MAEKDIRFQEAISKARVLLNNDFDIAYVRAKLAKDGFSEAEIDSILDGKFVKESTGNYHPALGSLVSSRDQFNQTDKNKNDFGNQARSNASTQVAIGLLIMAVGCAITFFTYTAAASNPNGGTYVVAWGAIIFGGLRVVRGLMNS